jgi:hypothetical protein
VGERGLKKLKDSGAQYMENKGGPSDGTGVCGLGKGTGTLPTDLP